MNRLAKRKNLFILLTLILGVSLVFGGCKKKQVRPAQQQQVPAQQQDDSDGSTRGLPQAEDSGDTTIDENKLRDAGSAKTPEDVEAMLNALENLDNVDDIDVAEDEDSDIDDF